MNRVMKFRAWNGEKMLLAFDLSQNPKYWWEENEDFPLMQYTGLKDKNGTEIYEGDIIKNHWYNIHDEFIGGISNVKFGSHMTSTDFYASEAYGWYVENANGEESLVQTPGEIEVIGNIYENSYLLKEEEE